MKAPKITYVCRECGYSSIKWLGKCPDCESWNTFDEIELRETPTKAKKSGEKAEKFSELKLPTYLRSETGMKELDRVIGGGLVDSSVVLL